MRDIAIYGAGGFGKETALMIEQINQENTTWRITGFFDDGLKKGDIVHGLSVLGGMEEVQQLKGSSDLVLAIADPLLRLKIVNQLKNSHVNFPVLIHPRALLGSERNIFGRGSIITAGCIFTVDVAIGDFCIVNLGSTVGHNVSLGNCSSIMPGCNISGNVTVGEASMIGTGAKVLQNITIGKGCKIGAGAVVINNVIDLATVVGIPAVQIK